MPFASIYVPDFPIQAVVRAEPCMYERAIALIDGAPPLENIVAMNQAAARAGLSLGMTKSQAKQFTSVAIRSCCRAQEEAAHATLLDIGWSVSPRVEDTAIDSVIIDLSGLSSLLGSEKTIAHLLARRASELGLFVHVAISSNLEVALHAARGFSGITMIPAGEESERLAMLPLRVFSSPAEIIETLERWGVRTCAALAKLPVLELSERLGQPGVQLHQWARGKSLRSIILAEPKICFEEEMALEYAVEELEPLAFLFARLLDLLCSRLSTRALSACALRVKLELDHSAAGESSSSCLLRPPAQAGEKKPYEKLLKLPVPMRNSKALLMLLRLHLQLDPPNAPILRIALRADAAPPRSRQEGLFQPSMPEPEKLELTIARLANVVGASNVGSPRIIDSHRPDAFEMSRFLPSHHTSQETICASVDRKPVAAFRVFRPALRGKVALHEGRPVHISFPNVNAKVTAASGPWRSSGEWWCEDAWDREEWDIEIRQPHGSVLKSVGNSSVDTERALYRIYYDAARQAWFVAGMYD